MSWQNSIVGYYKFIFHRAIVIEKVIIGRIWSGLWKKTGLVQLRAALFNELSLLGVSFTMG
jgi:hypothetical protein